VRSEVEQVNLLENKLVSTEYETLLKEFMQLSKVDSVIEVVDVEDYIGK